MLHSASASRVALVAKRTAWGRGTRPRKPRAEHRSASLIVSAKNGIFFSTSTGKTEQIADMIKEKLGEAAEGPFEVEEISDGAFAPYDNLIVGAPTWNTDMDSERSGTAWDAQDAASIGDMAGKRVAVFGLGDAAGYGEYFCDAMGELHDKFAAAGATMVGYVDSAAYDFEASKSVVDGSFVGLPLDEDNEDDQSEGRVEAWLEQLKGEMSL